MDKKKIYGICLVVIGLLLVIGALVVAYQQNGYADKELIIAWGYSFVGLGALSFFWQKLASYWRKFWPVPDLQTAETKTFTEPPSDKPLFVDQEKIFKDNVAIKTNSVRKQNNKNIPGMPNKPRHRRKKKHH